MQSMLSFERDLWGHGSEFIAGVDEAGRGPLAGPVVAAAVIFYSDVQIAGVDDSKKLSARRREALFDHISIAARAVGIGACDEKEIDRMNILQATYLAMRRALLHAGLPVQHVLVDGSAIPDLAIPQTAIIKGDQKCFSIAAASIIAKVTRDRMMLEYDRQFPHYGFVDHKGYATQKHIQAIRIHGLSPIHRTSFHVRELNDDE